LGTDVKEIGRWMGFYNDQHPHQALANLPPMQFRRDRGKAVT